MDRDRNLVFGILAVQLRRVTPAQLVEASALWLTDPAKSLGERLVQLGALTPSDLAVLNTIVDNTVKLHDGDVTRTYQSLRGVDEWHSYIMSAPDSAAKHHVSTMLGLPMDVRHVDTAEISAVDEVPGRYSRTSEYARGGMGRILLVHDQYLERDIALKELLPFEVLGEDVETRPPDSPVRASADIVSRFLREARVTGQLEHPSIVPVYELGRRPNGSLYYTMKLVRGQTLSRAIHDGDTLRDRLQFLPHVVDLCHAIAYAHSRGVIHRDIKPSNVMIGGFGETVVIDWGLARILGQRDVYAEELRLSVSRMAREGVTPSKTEAGVALGTPNYMAPEQADGRIDEVDARSDVYSLGVVLYELLTGYVPFQGKTSHDVLKRVMEEAPKPVRELQPEVPQELAAICAKAMAKDPADRFQTAGALADEIIRFQSGALVGSYRYSFRELLAYHYRKNRAVWNTAAVGVAAFLIVAIASYINIVAAHREERRQRILADRHAYLSDIRLADALEKNLEYDTARSILKQTNPELRGWEWSYLMAQANQDVAVLAGHENDVFNAEYSPDGSRILTVSADQSVGLWDPGTYQLIRRVEFPDTYVRHGSFSPDSRNVAVSLMDGTTRILDAVTGDEIQKLAAHTAPVNYSAFGADGAKLVTASSDGEVKVWDWRTPTLVQTMQGHQDEIEFAEFASRDSNVVSWSQDQDIRLWNVADASLLAAFQGFRARVEPGGKRFAYLAGNQAVVCDAQTGAEIYRTPPDEGLLNNARLASGDRLVTASLSGNARVWSLGSPEAIMSVSVGEPVWDAFLGVEGTKLVTEVSRGRLDLWDTVSGEKLWDLAGHGRGMTTAFFSPDGNYILTASRDSTARVWDARGPRMQDLVAQHDQGPVDLAVTAEGTTLATAGADDTLRIVDATSSRERYRIACQSIAINRGVSFGPDGHWFAAAMEETVPMVFETSSGALISRYTGHDGVVLDVACSPATGDVASVSEDGAIHIWDAATGEARVQLSGHLEQVLACTFDATGDGLATASSDNTAAIWDARSGAEIHRLAHPKPVACVAFNGDGSVLATGCNDRRVRLWDTQSGVLLHTMDPHSAMVSAVACLDGDRVLSASDDGTVSIADARHGAGYVRAQVAGTDFDTLVMLPNSSDVMVAAHSGMVQRWRVVGSGSAARSDADIGDLVHAFRREGSVGPAGPADGSVPVHVIVTPSILRTSIERLRNALASEASNETAVIAAGPASDAVARLCMKAGDVLAAVNDAPTEDAAAVISALDSWLSGDGAQPPTVTVGRAGGTFAYDFVVQEPIASEDSVRLSRADAVRLLEGARAVLTEGVEAVLLLNHEYAAAIGEPQPGRDDLAGLWMVPLGSPDGKAGYAMVHAQPRDRIVRVNGEPVRNRQQLLEWIEKALNALNAGTTGEAVFDIERGSLKTIRRTVAVE